MNSERTAETGGFIPRDLLEFNHNVRETINEMRISPQGYPGKTIPRILNEVSALVDEAISIPSNQEWIAGKQAEFEDYLRPVGIEAAEERYYKGLNLYVKTVYKACRDNPNLDFSDTKYLTQLIYAYTYDFVLSLRHSQRDNINPSIALQIVTNLHYYDPDTPHKIKTANPEFEQWAINFALVRYPRDPQGFLTKAKEKMGVLQTDFPELPMHVVREAVFHHPKQTSKFLEAVEQRVVNLREQFPNMPDWLIVEIATTYPTRAQEFLSTLTASIPVLEGQFPEFEPWVIAYAAVGYPSGSEAFLTKTKVIVEELKKLYPEFSIPLLTYAAVYHPNTKNKPHNTEDYLKSARKQIEELQKDYPHVPLTAIANAVIRRPLNPTEYLKEW